MQVEIDGVVYVHHSIRQGHDVAFYLSEHIDAWFTAKVTSVLTSTRVHLAVFEPNGFTIRKKVDIATDDRFKYRWLPLTVAHELEDNLK